MARDRHDDFRRRQAEIQKDRLRYSQASPKHERDYEDFADESNTCCCTLPPFLLKHAGKIGLGFFVLGVALAIGVALATGEVLPPILGTTSGASFLASIFFFKKACERDDATHIDALTAAFVS